MPDKISNTSKTIINVHLDNFSFILFPVQLPNFIATLMKSSLYNSCCPMIEYLPYTTVFVRSVVRGKEVIMKTLNKF